MIDETFSRIEKRVHESQGLNADAKAELLELIGSLRAEVGDLEQADSEKAANIAKYSEITAVEATKAEPRPELLEAASQGLGASVEGFEARHPKLVEQVNRLCVILSNMGI